MSATTLKLALGGPDRPEWQQTVMTAYYGGQRWAVAVDGHRLHAERWDVEGPAFPYDLGALIACARGEVEVDVSGALTRARKWLRPTRRLVVRLSNGLVFQPPFYPAKPKEQEAKTPARLRAEFAALGPLFALGTWGAAQAIDLRYLSEAVRHVGTTIVEASRLDELAPVLLRGETRLAIIMPVRQ
ncbi:MAG: hypothetical protein A2Y78_00270 [Acidobacteria bacterium RBG_13_68_16]|nr:MAG: hypothetical protein A2Y78_00270 [Acidobacteria bacterium RBG_13_68_16]